MPRPHVICHMVTTIDGKILTARWPKSKQGPANLFETTAASFKIPFWIVGNTTMKEFQGKPQKLKPVKTLPPGDFIANPAAKSLAIGADAKGVLRFQESEVQGDHVVLLVTSQVSKPYLAHLRAAGISYLVCGQRTLDLKLALEKLHKNFALKKLMLQGGGAFNGSMLAAGLVDEISHIILPIVDAGGPNITGFFDAPAPPPKGVALKLISHKTLPNGVLWTKYNVVR